MALYLTLTWSLIEGAYVSDRMRTLLLLCTLQRVRQNVDPIVHRLPPPHTLSVSTRAALQDVEFSSDQH